MKNEGTATARSVVKKEPDIPIFVQAEKMLEKMSALSRETAQKAYEFFIERGSLLGSHFDDWLRAEFELLQPVPVDVTETTDIVSVKAAVAGFQPAEIELSVIGDELFITGERKSENKKDDESTYYSEWRSDRFARRLRLPCEVEPDGVTATLKDGILAITLKKKPLVEPTTITVKAA
jgi:HSP20 family protein